MLNVSDLHRDVLGAGSVLGWMAPPSGQKTHSHSGCGSLEMTSKVPC